jgi:hypothetical protein
MCAGAGAVQQDGAQAVQRSARGAGEGHRGGDGAGQRQVWYFLKLVLGVCTRSWDSEVPGQS